MFTINTKVTHEDDRTLVEVRRQGVDGESFKRQIDQHKTRWHGPPILIYSIHRDGDPQHAASGEALAGLLEGRYNSAVEFLSRLEDATCEAGLYRGSELTFALDLLGLGGTE